MGSEYVSASASVYPGPAKITSVVCTPSTQSAGTVIVYNATAATAGTEVLKLRSPIDGSSVLWSDKIGIEVGNIYVAVDSAWATIVWD
jgi:hypothetical protein